jgi:transcriptional antiterminator RfaH
MTMSQTCDQWYVVQTQPNAEQRAISNLARQGFVTYLPRYLKRRRHARKTEVVSAPLFPRYVFVAIDMAARQWRSIQSTFGVSRLVCNGESPAAVSGWVVDQLKGREDASGYVQLLPTAKFAHGDKVRIVEGVFNECLGLFEDMTDRERVVVLLDLLGRKVRVVLDGSAVAAA